MRDICFRDAVLSLLIAIISWSAGRADPGTPTNDRIDFNRDIRPILSKNCFACHGPDEGHREAQLRLDLQEEAVEIRRKGRAGITPGKPEESLVILKIEEGTMPPPETGNEVSPAELELLKKWIRGGAPYARHWSFVPPQRVPLPTIPVEEGDTPIRSAIDSFILAQLQQNGLNMSPPADRFVLLRRVSLDLRGLPPTPEEVSSFANDASPDAYEKMVDKFLADPAFGERWARVWLDLARYADSAGLGSDPLRPNMYRFRDWIIDAFNQNMPYDQFTIEQLAGDLLPKPTLEQRIATAFHRNTMTNTEGGTDDEEFRIAAVKNRANTTFQVWMGLTFGCAQCHSHKYDPISHEEYYRFLAIFNQTADNDQPTEAPTIPAPTPEQAERNRHIDENVALLRRQMENPSISVVAELVLHPGLLPPLALIQTHVQIVALEKSRPSVANLPVMVELPADKQRTTHILNKGNFLDPGTAVEPGVPAAFHPLPEDVPANRLGVARWLLHPDNPLTARVAVNRFWARLFGRGLVETEEDFGTQGELPSHPELLDWLALEFRDSLKWDTKALLKLIVTSATYRQSARMTPELLERDPHNRLLSRGPRHRLEAEMIRDQALALSGLLSKTVGGPSVYPPQPDGLWQAAFNGQRTWTTSKGEDRYRRGLYTFWRRTIPYPSMAAFDAPSREVCAVRRPESNTPIQAFVTLNDPVYVECAQALARRIVREGGTRSEDRARFALQLCLARPPAPEQVHKLVALFERERAHYHQHKEEARHLATDPLGPLPDDMPADELAAWIVVANVLLNLDGVLTKG